MSFDPRSFDPKSFDPMSFDPMSVNLNYIPMLIIFKTDFFQLHHACGFST